MKHLFIGIFAFISIGLQAQQSFRNSDKIKNLEIAFITRELNLTIEEAQHFWPVFNKYKQEFKALVSGKKPNEDLLDKQQRVLDFRKRYRAEFLKVIPTEKVNQFFTVEAKFREMIRIELKQRQLKKVN
jgi:hypothetical protein